ncbi:MAG: nucleotidyltransferase [Comamonadaceae bacterium]|nr:nucleotidyltransferase [Comamonadaceae bacterium]
MLNLPEQTLRDFCRAHHVQRLSLFGSRLKGTHRPDSDMDLLVEFEPGHAPSMFGLVRMEAQLGDMLGQKVDLRTPGDLSRYFRQDVIDTAQVQYAA